MKDPTPPPVHGLRHDDLVAFCDQLGYPSYRADQIWRWLYVTRARDWNMMTNLPGALRDELAVHFSLDAARACQVQGKSRGTQKVLVGLQDGEQVETVLIPAAKRNTVCLSSQVGCRFNCSFCASGKAGLRRNLSPGEMIGQVLLAAELLGAWPTHVVFMGVGEPFDNVDAVLAAIRILNDPNGIRIGARRITISTCGIIPGIERLATEGLQIELSVSLHAPDSELRRQLMPVEDIYPMEALLESCRAYSTATGRIITFEYTLIEGLNDSRDHARVLAARLASLPCRVNLIPLSRIEEYEGQPATAAAANVFIEALSAHGINATVRDSKGAPLGAACGQLRIHSSSHYGTRHDVDL